MKKIKEYQNLYDLYRQSARGMKIAFWVSLCLFLLGFPSIIWDVPFLLVMLLILMGIPAIICGIMVLVMRIRAKKSLSRFSDVELAEIDREIPLCEVQEGIMVTRHAVVLTKGGLRLCPVRNVLWIYRDVFVQKWMFIPIYKQTILTICGKDRKRYTYKVKNKTYAEGFLRSELSKYRMDIIYGYDRGLEPLFRKDIQRLIAIAENYGRRMESAQNETYR